MRIPSGADRHREKDTMMTPMIDVVFLLLIFFVCTASFQIIEEVLPSSLLASGGDAPDIDVEPEIDLERVLVKIARDDTGTTWNVNDRYVDNLADVRDVLSAVAEVDLSLPVILDVAGGVPLGDVIDVYDLARRVGFERIQFAASVEI